MPLKRSSAPSSRPTAKPASAVRRASAGAHPTTVRKRPSTSPLTKRKKKVSSSPDPATPATRKVKVSSPRLSDRMAAVEERLGVLGVDEPHIREMLDQLRVQYEERLSSSPTSAPGLSPEPLSIAQRVGRLEERAERLESLLLSTTDALEARLREHVSQSVESAISRAVSDSLGDVETVLRSLVGTAGALHAKVADLIDD